MITQLIEIIGFNVSALTQSTRRLQADIYTLENLHRWCWHTWQGEAGVG